MATNTCTELIIHSEYQSYHLNATHSNISFGIALRNLANKSLENQNRVTQPIGVALPTTETTLNPVEPEQMVIEYVVNEVPTQIGTTLASSSSMIHHLF